MLLEKIKKNKIKISLILITILAAFLRLWGIKHGFPFIFHPDEPTIINSALAVRFDSNPGHFDWPHLYIYLNYFLYMLFGKFRNIIADVGLRDQTAIWFPLMWDEKIVFYYLTRCFSAILGALTVIPVFLTAKNLFGRKVGLLSALAFSLMPYHVRHSHYALGDVPMAFFLSWAMYFSSLIMKSNNLRNYIFSGLFVGLAASNKYNGGLSALMVPVAHFMRIFSQRYGFKGKENESNVKDNQKAKIIDFKGILYLFISGLSAFIGFLIGTPYALFDFRTFSSTEYGKGAFWQFENVGSLKLLDHINTFFGDITNQLLSDTGYTIMIIYILGLIFLIYKLIKKRISDKDFFLLFFYLISLFLIWYISGFEKSRSHYYFVFYPFAAVIFGYYTCFLYKFFTKIITKRETFFAFLFLIALFSLPTVFSFKQSYSFHKGDTRNDLYTWLLNNYHPEDAVVYNDNDVLDVLRYIGIEPIKNLDNVRKYDKALIIVSEPGEDEDEFFIKRGSYMSKIEEFSNNLRLGPRIDVYSYENY